MLIGLIIALLLGILFGTITGIFPGIHINLVGAALVALSSSVFSKVPVIYLVVFISSMAIAHTLLDFIPSIFIGCPETDTELSILPGHELLKKGQGYEAVMRTAYGGIYAVFILVIFAFPLAFITNKTYPFIQQIIPYILILICIIMVISEKNKLQAATALILTGILGFFVLKLDLKESLLPLLGGLFGSSMLLLSIRQNTKIPSQNFSFKKMKFKEMLKPLSGALISSPICGFLPGLGGSQAAILGSQITRTNEKDFLVLLGAVNVLVMGLSFVSLYSIEKTRTGAAAAIQTISGTLSSTNLIIILFACLISGIISFFIAKKLSQTFLKIIEKMDYKKFSIGILIFLSLLILTLSGIIGFLVFIISTATGIYCISLNIRKTQMMGCLLIPTIILYLF